MSVFQRLGVDVIRWLEVSMSGGQMQVLLETGCGCALAVAPDAVALVSTYSILRPANLQGCEGVDGLGPGRLGCLP